MGKALMQLFLACLFLLIISDGGIIRALAAIGLWASIVIALWLLVANFAKSTWDQFK